MPSPVMAVSQLVFYIPCPFTESVDTVNPRYNDNICSQKCCHYNEFAVVKNL